jgi:hypothetical protein
LVDPVSSILRSVDVGISLAGAHQQKPSVRLLNIAGHTSCISSVAVDQRQGNGKTQAESHTTHDSDAESQSPITASDGNAVDRIEFFIVHGEQRQCLGIVARHDEISRPESTTLCYNIRRTLLPIEQTAKYVKSVGHSSVTTLVSQYDSPSYTKMKTSLV